MVKSLLKCSFHSGSFNDGFDCATVITSFGWHNSAMQPGGAQGQRKPLQTCWPLGFSLGKDFALALSVSYPRFGEQKSLD